MQFFKGFGGGGGSFRSRGSGGGGGFPMDEDLFGGLGGMFGGGGCGGGAGGPFGGGSFHGNGHPFGSFSGAKAGAWGRGATLEVLTLASGFARLHRSPSSAEGRPSCSASLLAS
jgi:hypothetical protein